MRSLSGAPLAAALGSAVLVLGSVMVAGCGRVGELQAKKAFKEANQAYQQQDYKKAAELYEQTIQAAPDSQPAHQAHFFLGNSYDNLYKPSKKGEADNDALLTKAVDNYTKAAESLAVSTDPIDKTLGKRSMEYLVSTYGSEKLNDPGKAEPVLQKMIQQDPGDPTYYFQLAKLYEDAGVYDAAEQMYVKGKEAKPGDSAGYMQLAGYYNRQGQFDKTIEALEQRAAREPNNPEAYYTISTFYWDKAFRDAHLKEAEKKDFVDKGVQAIDHALQIKPDYAEALVYKGLLLRLKANMEKDPKVQKELLNEADKLRDRANELRKKTAAGTND
ncbi:MAG TPA: tetratricopeptide repeat protein [Vicinamibacterales bacterium]|jgi:tetratricopeptide (TPR) repeat protein|nr:tetratricopeptide repeat protein [Vicinamibacterales bacterium]